MANAANLKTYIPSKINKKSHKGTYGSGIPITKLLFNDAFETKTR
jgi:hypothetical protein